MTSTDKWFLGAIAVLAVLGSAFFVSRALAPKKTVTVPVISSVFREQSATSVNLPAASRYGNQIVSSGRFIPAHWELAVEIEGKKRLISIPVNDRELAKAKQIKVTYHFTKDGDFVQSKVTAP